MTSKGDTPTRSKDLSATHSGPVIIKTHNLKNRVPLSSLANVGCKKDVGISANSWMTNATVYPRSDSTTADVTKLTTNFSGVSVAESDRPVASDSVEFALQSLFHSDTSMLASTPNQNPKHMSVEAVEKILKTPPPPEKSDDDDLTIVFDSYACQNAISNCDANLPVTKPSGLEPANKTTTKVLILRKKNSDTVKSGLVKAGRSSTTSIDLIDLDRQVNGKSAGNTEKSITDQISPRAPSFTTNDTKLGCKGINKNGSNNKSVNNDLTFQIKPSSNNCGDKDQVTYVQVENELEKMFAGIEDNLDPSAKQTNLSVTSAAKNLSSPRKKCNKNPCTGVNVPAKTAKKNLSKNSKPTATKDLKNNNKQNLSSFSIESPSLDPMRKIPVIHIGDSKDNPMNGHIINSMKSADELSNKRTSVKRKLEKCDPAVKTTTSNFESKNHESASSDASWVCVFCNLSANVPGMAGEAIGDLFGPYFIRMPDQINSDGSKIHSRRTIHSEQGMKKHKGSLTNLSPPDDQKSVEVWAHENCIVWASGVHLIGSKLIGLEEAVMQALETVCAHCSNRGASIGCRARNCNSCAHCSCALHMGWKLDTDTFISTCRAHSAPMNA